MRLSCDDFFFFWLSKNVQASDDSHLCIPYIGAIFYNITAIVFMGN